MPRLTSAELIEELSREGRGLARLLTEERVQPFLGLDLTLSQLKTLLLVASGMAHTGRELADRLRVSAPSVSAGVDRLVELGYLSRAESANDRRVKTLAPTRRGSDLYNEIVDHRAASDELLMTLDPDDLAALVRGISALRRAAQVHLSPAERSS